MAARRCETGSSLAGSWQLAVNRLNGIGLVFPGLFHLHRSFRACCGRAVSRGGLQLRTTLRNARGPRQGHHGGPNEEEAGPKDGES